MEIKIFTDRHTHCYFLGTSGGWVMIDAGWPGSLPKLRRFLKDTGVSPADIKFLMVTHFHPDHGGMVQDIKDWGATLVLHESQVLFLPGFNAFFKRKPEFFFREISLGDNLVLSGSAGRTWLEELGLQGEIVPTPGHSDDSVSLVIDNVCAFTGDLPSLNLVEGYHDPRISESWAVLRNFGVKEIFPAHGPSWLAGLNPL